MTVAPFVPSDWRTQYPEFTGVSDPLAISYFNTACLFLNNTDSSPVPCDAATFVPRQGLLYLLTAHVAKIQKLQTDGTLANPIVGRINNTSEGTVSVAAEYKAAEDASWYLQTPYGATYWQATAQYRLARYRVRRSRRFPF